MSSWIDIGIVIVIEKADSDYDTDTDTEKRKVEIKWAGKTLDCIPIVNCQSSIVNLKSSMDSSLPALQSSRGSITFGECIESWEGDGIQITSQSGIRSQQKGWRPMLAPITDFPEGLKSRGKTS